MLAIWGEVTPATAHVLPPLPTAMAAICVKRKLERSVDSQEDGHKHLRRPGSYYLRI